MTKGSQQRDAERIKRICEALERANMDALVCALPTNVLLVSGYWPVIGTSLAVITRSGMVHLLAPDDEAELARASWADVVETLSFGSLAEIKTAVDVLRAPLTAVIKDLGHRDRIVVGCETGPIVQPASYVGMHLFGTAIHELLREILSTASIASADDLLAQLRSVMTPSEQTWVRRACEIAGSAFLHRGESLRPTLKETDVATLFRASLVSHGGLEDNGARADGYVFCMSGPNSAEAYAAYQRSRSRELQCGDLVLLHCNSYLNGYWTDITRTFCFAPINERKQRMYEAIFAARDAALAAIHPGVRAADVDRAARVVLTDYGFAKEFKHGLGHGVGFAAINHNAVPRLHPASDDILEPGMIFNIEPAIYFEGFGGIRHCDVVLLTDDGPEVLTPFQSTIESLTIA
ncbi:MAG TPA: M24 family metallopeptidase [Pyrinomonadaceae bacterium]